MGIDAGDVDLVPERDGGEDLRYRVRDFLSGFLAFAEGEDGRTGAGDRETEGAGGEGGAFCFVEIRDEFLPTWLGDHVVNRSGNQTVVFLNEPENQATEVADLLGGVH